MKTENKKYVIATIKSWNIARAKKLAAKAGRKNVLVITEKHGLNPGSIGRFKPRYIFFPHWSWIIPAEIYGKYECVVFHMTDLPFGRGGSPLQNLIARGIAKTKISAIRVEGGIDTGPVYMKMPLSLDGDAASIFNRASALIFDKMIPRLMKDEPAPRPQRGKVVKFRRRFPEDGDISRLSKLGQVNDYIRMLDAEGYPNAFMATKHFNLGFTKAKYRDGAVKAIVTITRRKPG